MKRLTIDIESFSEADLGRVGVYAYAAHPSTCITVAAWSVDGGPVQTWTYEDLDPPEDLLAMLADPDIEKLAHNAAFEYVMLKAEGWDPGPVEAWRCSMVAAYSLALPGALADLCEILGLPEDKQKLDDGRRLVLKFCKPGRKDKVFDAVTDPEDWRRFVEYCAQDVVATNAAWRVLARFPMPADEWQLYALDQKINARGLPVDLDLVEAALDLRELDEHRTKARAYEITGLENVNSVAQVKAWLAERGFEVDDLTKATVTALLREDLPDDVREVLELRQNLAKTSTTKFAALQRATDPVDSRVRGCFQMNGAGRTGRFAGRIFQPQNLAKGGGLDLAEAREAVLTRDPDLVELVYDNVPRMLSSLVRPAIRAPKGKKLVVSDLVSIESVMLAWAARCEYLLDLFRKGRDSYKDYATHLYGVKYDDVTKQQRADSKPATLGCGYMLGAKGLVAYAEGFGLALTEEQAQISVDTFRNAYPEIPTFWYALDDAVRDVIIEHSVRKVGAFRIYYERPFLFIDLPSGRRLAYLQPRIEPRRTPWGETRPTVTYNGREIGRKNFVRLATHPGKVCENLVQSIARDVLVHGLRRAEADPDLEVIGHVHDEIICLADEDDDTALDRLSAAMSVIPDWCSDAPIRADGWTGRFYRKD